ncbi:hypothetical protein [Neobacillus sp. NPDC093127]
MVEKQPFVIKELKSEREWRDVFQVMKQLRTHLDEACLLELEMAAVMLT